jgi:hypothetical protein
MRVDTGVSEQFRLLGRFRRGTKTYPAHPNWSPPQLLWASQTDIGFKKERHRETGIDSSSHH